MPNDIDGSQVHQKLGVTNMEEIIEELKKEVQKLAEEHKLNEKAIKILHWFAEESLGLDGRISRSKLKQQVTRLGKATLSPGDE
jgi:hypothetical protein